MPCHNAMNRNFFPARSITLQLKMCNLSRKVTDRHYESCLNRWTIYESLISKINWIIYNLFPTSKVTEASMPQKIINN